MESNTSEIMISVCCITYNHGKFISNAVEGFLMQRTDFEYEILIGEDCSTDGTREILDEYASKYPDKIKLITSENNVGANNNVVRTIQAARGKYTAFCDGDDYWINPDKLQKQVDFLENNPDYVICCHYYKEIDSTGNLLYVNPNPVTLEYDYNDLIVNRQAETATSSLVVRKDCIKDLFDQEWYPNCNAADKFLKLFATFYSRKKIYVIPEVMSCYRKHNGGVWSMKSAEFLRKKQLSDFNIIVNNFNHSFIQKISLFLFYLKRYFLFEVRNTRFTDAVHTVRSIF